MRLAAAFLLALSLHLALSLQAAVIQGVVLDEETGNPLARTQVTLTPLPGTQAGTISVTDALAAYTTTYSGQGATGAALVSRVSGRPPATTTLCPSCKRYVFEGGGAGNPTMTARGPEVSETNG
jgi:hypothetical protein